MKNIIINALMSTHREGMDKLVEHMETIGYFTAPSSGAYHCSCTGGLMEHSYNVWQFGLTNIHLDQIGIDFQTWKIVALLHDLGKADYHGKPNYVPNILKGGKVSEAKPFKTNPDRLYIPHEAVSVFIASQFIELTDEEEFAIIYHNGMYTSLGRDIQGKERPLQQVLHFADMYSSRFIESNGKGDDE